VKNLKNLKWRSVTEECDLHIERIRYALSQTKRLLPMSVESYENLTNDDISYLDQLIYRFLKLQDTMGERLFPLALALLGENVESKPFIDLLNRLERLELIPSKEEWFRWRELRNDLTHEYPDNDNERIEAINTLSKTVEKLIDVFRNIHNYIEQRIR